MTFCVLARVFSSPFKKNKYLFEPVLAQNEVAIMFMTILFFKFKISMLIHVSNLRLKELR